MFGLHFATKSLHKRLDRRAQTIDWSRWNSLLSTFGRRSHLFAVIGYVRSFQSLGSARRTMDWKNYWWINSDSKVREERCTEFSWQVETSARTSRVPNRTDPNEHRSNWSIGKKNMIRSFPLNDRCFQRKSKRFDKVESSLSTETDIDFDRISNIE